MSSIDGKQLANAWLDDIAVQVRALGAPLHLAALCVGNDVGLRSFVRLKQKAAQSAGIQFSSYFFDAQNQTEVQETLRYLADDDSVHGIFVELPLPSKWDVSALLKLIPAHKDVDALTRNAFVPEPAVRALQYVLDAHSIDVASMRAVVVGYGRLVGAPIAQWLKEQGAHVDVIDIDTKNPSRIASRASLIVAGVGEPGLVKDSWVKEGATVIDFGYADGKGDVHESAHKKAGLSSPVPGGMGPLVIAAVLENLLLLATQN